MNPAEFANIARSERDFWWYRGMREIMFALLDAPLSQRQPKLVLDAGCGTGYFAQAVEQRYGVPTHAIDYGLEGARYGKGMGLDRIAQCDVRQMPFPDGTFDLVLSMDVIVHFPPGDESAALAEMVRVLAPGGLLAIRVSALDALRSRHSQFAHERQRFTRSRLLRSVRPHGLRVMRCTYVNALLSPIAFAKFRVWEPVTRQQPASGVQPVAPWLDRLLHIPLAVESSVIRKGGGFPFGQSLILLAEKTTAS